MLSALTNLGAITGLRAMQQANREMSLSLERLATGKQLNRTSDNPSGMATVIELDGREAVIRKKLDRIGFEEAMLGAKEGAQSVISDLVIDLQGLITRAANTGATSEEERKALQIEADSILKTIDHLGQTTTFNGQQIISWVSAQSLGLAGLDLINGDMKNAQDRVKSVVGSMTDSRAAIGSVMKQFDSERNTLMTELEAIMGVRSQIEDTDYAAETANMVRAKVLAQAATFVTQIAAKTKADTVLQLLGGVKG